jgi:hypothetical protein
MKISINVFPLMAMAEEHITEMHCRGRLQQGKEVPAPYRIEWENSYK